MRVKSCIICSLSLVNFQARMPLFPNWESNTLQLVQRMHVDWTIKLMSDIRAKSIPFPETLLTTTISHCSYLNIYISQKIRLCAVDFEREISNQPTGQIHHFFCLEIYIFCTHFSSIFWRICQIHCFLQTDAAIPKCWHVWIAILHQIAIQAVDLTNSAKNKIKFSVIDLNFQPKKSDGFGL